MSCITPEGMPTESGLKILQALQSWHSPEEIAREAGLPLFRVRSGLRDMMAAGLAELQGEEYHLTEKGANFLK